VTPGGVILDSSGIVISRALRDQYYPKLSFDGTNYLVVWSDERVGTSDIYGARVTPEGEVLDPEGIVISGRTADELFPVLACDGVNFLVAWTDRRGATDDVYGARVTPTGQVLDTAGIAITHALMGEAPGAVCFDGENFLVSSTDNRSGTCAIYGSRVTPQGTVLDTAGFVISQSPANAYGAALSFDGTNFLAVWQDQCEDDGDIHGARVTPGGVVLDPDGFVISDAAYLQYNQALCFDGTGFLAVWQDYRGGYDWDVYAARVTPQATVLDPAGFAAAQAIDDQECPVTAFDGTNFLVAWVDGRDTNGYNLHGARVTPEGRVLDSAHLVISHERGDEWLPAVAFGGTSFLVAWEDFRNGDYPGIYGARVTGQGALLDTAGFVISQAADAQIRPEVGFDGANFLVVWENWRYGGYDDIYGARVTPAGEVLDPTGILISQAEYDQSFPRIGFDGTNFLVVWEDWRNGDDQSDIYGARVTPAGEVLDPAGLAISRAAIDQRTPALGFDGTNFLVAWEDWRTLHYSDIYGARVTPQGKVLDSLGIVISQGAEYKSAPALDFDGTNFFVVWVDCRAGVDIYGARVTPGGTVFDPGPVVIQEGSQRVPRLCRGNGGQMFLVYQGWAGEVGGKAYNAQRIWGKMDPNPAIAEMTKPEVRRANGPATVVRGMLYLPPSLLTASSALLSIDGRKVMDLKSGANDVRALAPGVYFVRRPETGDGRPGAAIRKVVVTR
jgi:phosphoribosylformylglycinamidine (FGAM) synthase PurS component